MVALVQSDCAEELLELSEFSESPFDPGGLTGEAKAKHILRAVSTSTTTGIDFGVPLAFQSNSWTVD